MSYFTHLERSREQARQKRGKSETPLVFDKPSPYVAMGKPPKKAAQWKKGAVTKMWRQGLTINLMAERLKIPSNLVKKQVGAINAPTCHPDKKYEARGLCQNCYARQIRNGWRSIPPEDILEMLKSL